MRTAAGPLPAKTDPVPSEVTSGASGPGRDDFGPVLGYCEAGPTPREAGPNRCGPGPNKYGPVLLPSGPILGALGPGPDVPGPGRNQPEAGRPASVRRNDARKRGAAVGRAGEKGVSTVADRSVEAMLTKCGEVEAHWDQRMPEAFTVRSLTLAQFGEKKAALAAAEAEDQAAREVLDKKLAARDALADEAWDLLSTYRPAVQAAVGKTSPEYRSVPKLYVRRKSSPSTIVPPTE